ncbi:MAG TPA: hypothetical protein DCO75_11800, partial [Fibrobacteres bacterium]|nr:hypothetical protein [Fibrobacterota bacterium]
PDAFPVALKGKIVMNNMTFKYSGKETSALERITLTIPAGESLGIIGKPGSGKTTLASLLFHLFPIPRGCLLIDGFDINDIPLDILRKSIGYVPQDSFLFSETIEKNIAFGSHDSIMTHEEIENAARIASIEKDIEGFPNGFSTMVGERGITLSGGQKQRIAIARAILSKPPILIFDDALSSVDAGTEREIKTAIEREIHGRTTLIIAHRISTVCACNNIIVLENGKITEQGTHEELINLNGFYAKLHALQKMKDRDA